MYNILTNISVEVFVIIIIFLLDGMDDYAKYHSHFHFNVRIVYILYRWTRADTVTVLVSSCAFKTTADLDNFIETETKLLRDRMQDSISKALESLKSR